MMTDTRGGDTPEPTRDIEPGPAEVAHRLDRLARTGNPDVLWPDVSRDRRIAAAHAITSAIGPALTGQPARLDHHDRPAIGIAAFVSGVGPLLGRWIADGLVTADPAVAHLLTTHLELGRARYAHLAIATGRLVTLLRDLGVEPIVLKGPHLATYYPEPGARMQSDVDLLLPSGARAAVETHLREAGWMVRRGPYDDRRVTWQPPDAPTLPTWLDRAGPDDPWTLDLHWTLDRARGALTARLGDATSVARTTIAIDRQAMTVLGHPDFLLFVASHASLGFDELQLCRLVDLVLATRATPDLWWEALAAARERRMPDLLFPSAALTARLAPGVVPTEVLRALRAAANPRMRSAVDAVDGGTLLHRDVRTLRQKLMWARHPTEILRTLVSLMAVRQPATWRRRLRLVAGRLWRGHAGRGG